MSGAGLPAGHVLVGVAYTSSRSCDAERSVSPSWSLRNDITVYAFTAARSSLSDEIKSGFRGNASDFIPEEQLLEVSLLEVQRSVVIRVRR